MKNFSKNQLQIILYLVTALLILFFVGVVYLLSVDTNREKYILTSMQKPPNLSLKNDLESKVYYSSLVVSNESSLASAFLVDSLIVTAAHLVKNIYKDSLPKTIDAYFSGAQESIPAKIVKFFPGADVLILQPDSIPEFLMGKYLSIDDLALYNEEPSMGDYFYGYGFPGLAFTKIQGQFCKNKSRYSNLDYLYVLENKQKNISGGASGTLLVSEKTFCMLSGTLGEDRLLYTVSGKRILEFLNIKFFNPIISPSFSLEIDDIVGPDEDDRDIK